ncbi:hypothetical protein LV82_00268 [Albidovulum inexpectatum]|uniref:Secreted protein n=1 Tax=Albidovulum inexpectatum TaxID=196587 RepID=A0A2S5JLL5_9RHOB|nr:hypothetical protein [Albidovulum inexpectatum]PPB82340.1 hypothetical protein LV82_00268 [Albidovulum inexpectatum]
MRVALLFILLACPAFADSPNILAAEAARSSDGRWTISVTISHPDTGWDHFADGWEVLDPQGARLGLRPLAHPHVNEQPFTRSLSGVAIPAGTSHVEIRARCSMDGWSGSRFRLDLDNAGG